MKTVICGPPHSGKSVFIANLTHNLPSNIAIIRACPDGEGTWSNNKDQEDVQAVRRKGKFSQEFIQESCDIIDKQPKEVITLIDVGGIMSPENKEVFSHCDSFIVISSDEQKKAEWERFGKEAGLKCLASLSSSLTEREETIIDGDIVRGTITGLERGTFLQDSQLLKALTEKIYEHNPNALTYDEEHTKIATITNEKLRKLTGHADDLEGRWEPSDISKCLSVLGRYQDTEVALYGIKANFIAAACVNQLKEQNTEVQLFDMHTRDYLPVVSLKSGEENDQGDYKLTENKDSVLLEGTSKTDFMDKTNFEKGGVPEIDKDKHIYISGRLPHWALADIINTYPNDKISVYQPGIGAICVSNPDPRKNRFRIANTGFSRSFF